MGFLDKLKGDMGIESPEEKEEKKKPAEAPPEVKAEKPKPKPKKEEFQSEGQLSIDVYEANGDLVIQSTIAGVKAEDLDISIENDLVTIRGNRRNPEEGEGKKYLYQECYWGPFSRKAILPEEVDSSRVEAKMKDGILTLRMPKVHKRGKSKVVVKQEEE